MTRAERKAQRARLDVAYDRLAKAVVDLVWPTAKREIERAPRRAPAAMRHRVRHARIAA